MEAETSQGKGEFLAFNVSQRFELPLYAERIAAILTGHLVSGNPRPAVAMSQALRPRLLPPIS